jgi:hypothetical protein
MSKVAIATSDGEHGFAGQQAKGAMQQKTIHGLDMVAMPNLSKANEETLEAAEIVHERHKNLRELWLQGQEGEEHGHHHPSS